MGRIWECKIGEAAEGSLPPGSDGPMRDAVEAAFKRLTGGRPQFTFSGWGGRLTETQRAVVEDREPDPSLFTPEVEPIIRNGSRLFMHTCGRVEWIGDAERNEIGGGCDGCESGSSNPLDWSQLYVPLVR